MSRFAATLRRLIGSVEGIGSYDFRVKLRAGLNAENWRHHREKLLQHCAAHEQPVLLVIDELSILLKRMLDSDDGARQVNDTAPGDAQ